jgi:hypothetical protein
MKFATIVLLGILLLGSSAALNAQPAGTSQVVLAMTGESVMTSDMTAVCIVYYQLIGDIPVRYLFAPSMLFAQPMVDRAHAYFIWVSDYSMQTLPANKDSNFFALIPEGEGTIYFTDRPDLRDWSNLTERSTWGQPVAKFIRKAGVFQSADGGVTGTFVSSAILVSSQPVNINGKPFDFKDLAPHGMTCYETCLAESEAGTCVAIGGGL